MDADISTLVYVVQIGEGSIVEAFLKNVSLSAQVRKVHHFCKQLGVGIMTLPNKKHTSHHTHVIQLIEDSYAGKTGNWSFWLSV